MFVNWISRSVTTPYKLPWFNAPYSLRLLLTPAERRRPWLLYLTPGLLASEALRSIYVILMMDPVRVLISPSKSDGSDDASHLTLARICGLFVLAFVSTIIICPLEVMSTRLSIQRNHDTSGFTPVSQEEAPVEDAAYAAADEDVIG